MIGDLGAPELLIILAIVILLFGAGKVGRLGKDLGTAVREFRSAVQDEETEKSPPVAEPAALLLPPAQHVATISPAPSHPETTSSTAPPTIF